MEVGGRVAAAAIRRNDLRAALRGCSCVVIQPFLDAFGPRDLLVIYHQIHPRGSFNENPLP